jgi:xanthine dehydrogenase YagR molybdenum-binding subunit
VKIVYAPEPFVVSPHDPKAKESKPSQAFGDDLQITRGHVDRALAAAGADKIVVDQTYITPVETHNPMEPSATVAIWDGDRLTIHDSTQFMTGTQAVVAEAFGIPREKVRVLCPFVGGAFGCKGFQWPHTLLAAAAAKMVNRPVKLILSRDQMFTSCGHRPTTEQKLMLAATKDGKLIALRHDTLMHGSTVGEHVESCGIATSKLLYAVPNASITHTVKHVNVGNPTPMRAPGECPGTFALESAMDELAAALSIDPVELRLTNYADVHPQTKKPWSSKHLNECYRIGAEKFGWSKRDAKPRSMRDDQGRLIGWGMATATYPAYRFPAMARLRLLPDGSGGVRVIASSATHDLGTGAYTVFTQLAAEAVGLPVEKVKFELGDSNLPKAPVAGGSNSTASVGHALALAGEALKAKLVRFIPKGSPLTGMKPAQLVLDNGTLASFEDPSKSETLVSLLRASGQAAIEADSASKGQIGHGAEDYEGNVGKYAFQSFGAHFVEVAFDEPISRLRVNRVVSVIDNGRVVNPKTGRSQIMGGVIMGIGMALMEETVYSAVTGRLVNNNLADYAVCVNPDIHSIDVNFINKPDPHFNAFGGRGIGEIGITGVAAAVANAVYHATGKRIRDLPITMDKLITA